MSVKDLTKKYYFDGFITSREEKFEHQDLKKNLKKIVYFEKVGQFCF
jgi:hypothetical protein